MLALAQRFALLKARAVTIQALCKISGSQAAEIYTEVHRKASPSGQTPTDMGWYWKSPRIHKFSDLFFGAYLNDRNNRSHANMATWFLGAYEFIYALSRLMYQIDQPVLDVERALYLVKMWESYARFIAKSAVNSPSMPFQYIPCTRCSTNTLAPPHLIHATCSTCLDRHKKGRTPDTHALGLDPHYIMV